MTINDIQKMAAKYDKKKTVVDKTGKDGITFGEVPDSYAECYPSMQYEVCPDQKTDQNKPVRYENVWQPCIIYRVLQAVKWNFEKKPKMIKNDIFGSQNDDFWSFFKVFSLFQNFIFQLAAPYIWVYKIY